MDTANQICVFTAFSLVPKNRLMRRCCLIHLKNSSTCQRLLYRARSSRPAERVVGQEDQRLARLGILETDAPQMLGVVPGGVEAVERRCVWSQITPVERSVGAE